MPKRPKYHLLLVFSSLLFLLGVTPFFPFADSQRFLWSIVFACTLLFALTSLSTKKNHLFIGFCLLIPSFIFEFLGSFIAPVHAEAFAIVFQVLFLLFFIYVELRYVVAQEKIGLDSLLAGGCTYIFLGLLWALVYRFIEITSPGGFASMTGKELTFSSPLLTYYSFVTLSTLGYGDIIPVRETTQSLAFLEAILGQIYLSFFVAQLVGMRISERIQETYNQPLKDAA